MCWTKLYPSIACLQRPGPQLQPSRTAWTQTQTLSLYVVVSMHVYSVCYSRAQYRTIQTNVVFMHPEMWHLCAVEQCGLFLYLLQLSTNSFSVWHLGGVCIDKHPEGPLLFHSPQVIFKEPWENGKSTRSAGSPQEETGMLPNSLMHILTSTRIAELPFVSLGATSENQATI